MAKDLSNSITNFIRAHGAYSLTEFFNDDRWSGFAAILEDHLEDARNDLEVAGDMVAIRYIQGQVNALRTILDLSDIAIDVAKQLQTGMPDEKQTEEEKDNERPFEPDQLV